MPKSATKGKTSNQEISFVKVLIAAIRNAGYTERVWDWVAGNVSQDILQVNPIGVSILIERDSTFINIGAEVQKDLSYGGGTRVDLADPAIGEDQIIELIRKHA